MLAQRVSDWTREWKHQGWIEGMEQGIERGIEQGIEQGIERGIEQGIEQGIKEGIKEGFNQGLDLEKTLLVQLIERRFGQTVSIAAKDIIQPITRPDTLNLIGCLIIDCQDGTDFLDKTMEIAV